MTPVTVLKLFLNLAFFRRFSFSFQFNFDKVFLFVTLSIDIIYQRASRSGAMCVFLILSRDEVKTTLMAPLKCTPGHPLQNERFWFPFYELNKPCQNSKCQKREVKIRKISEFVENSQRAVKYELKFPFT